MSYKPRYLFCVKVFRSTARSLLGLIFVGTTPWMIIIAHMSQTDTPYTFACFLFRFYYHIKRKLMKQLCFFMCFIGCEANTRQISRFVRKCRLIYISLAVFRDVLLRSRAKISREKCQAQEKSQIKCEKNILQNINHQKSM